MTCLSAYMYRKIYTCADKTPKKHYGGGGGQFPPSPPPPPLATLVATCIRREMYPFQQSIPRALYLARAPEIASSSFPETRKVYNSKLYNIF